MITNQLLYQLSYSGKPFIDSELSSDAFGDEIPLAMPVAEMRAS
tara:strand:+ start:385 stop:516 length:132 start_codon:yes stop_codon:yes gene_type:complete